MGGCQPKGKSEVEIMWTNQHGTGLKTDDRVETQVILQYMCQAYPEGEMATNEVNREFEHHTIRNAGSITEYPGLYTEREVEKIPTLEKTEDFITS